MRFPCVAMLLLVAFPLVGLADDDRDPGPLVTDRPDATESAVTVDRGFVQIEAGYLFASLELRGEKVELSSIPTTLVRVGLAPKVELRFDWFGYISESRDENGERSDDSGPGNTALGLKIGLREERGAAPRLAILVDAILPTGDKGLRTERIDPRIRVLGSNTLSERLSLGYNLGFSALTLEDDAGGFATHGVGTYTVSLGIGITERWGTFTEFFGFIPTSGPESPANLFDFGFTWLASNSVQLDVSGGVGLNDHADDWFASAGFSIRLPR